jgi:hypothetical protein
MWDALFESSEVTKTSEDGSVNLQTWQREQGAIKAVADLIKDIVQSIRANADGGWAHQKSLRLFCGRRRKKAV